MLQDIIIEESIRLWSSCIVAVPKPDGSLRFDNDFRNLNMVSDLNPLLRVDD